MDGAALPAAAVAEPPKKPRVRPTEAALDASRRQGRASRIKDQINIFKSSAQLHPPGVAGSPQMAMDDATTNNDINAWAFNTINATLFDGQAFLGYPLLAEMAVRPEYRRISETIARHMTRKWIEFQVKGDADPEKEKAEEETEGPTDELDFDEPDEDEQRPEGAADFAPPGLEDDGGEGEKVTAPQPDPEAMEQHQAEQKTKAEAAAPDQEKLDKIAKIEERLEEISAKVAFYKVAEQDGFFGRAHMYIDLGSTDSPEELKTSIGDGQDDATLTKLANKKGAIKKLKPVEAVWCYPTNYNSTDPLADDWYKPSNWFVMGKEISATRLITFVGREVPDILKPAYSFGGLSMSQMVRPYVENWINTRQAVADIVKAFSIFVLKTKLTDALAEQGDALFRRIEMFNNFRDNSGAFVVDKDAEDFTNVSAPLGSLDKLQAQAQEQMASIAGIPIVLLLMITPSGLNASSEGEIQAFWDWVHSYQESFFRAPLTTIINMIQVCEFGEVDPDITFTFSRLEGLNDLEWSQKVLAEAQTYVEYVNAAIVDPVEVRKVLAADTDSPFHGIDVSDVPLPDPSEMMGAFGPPGEEGEEAPPGQGGGPPKQQKGAATGAPAGKASPAVSAAKVTKEAA